LLRKPWVFGDQVSRLVSRYSFRHNHFWFVQRTLRFTFILQQNAPLPRTTPAGAAHPQLRWWTWVPDIVGAGLLDQWAITHSL